MNKVKKKTFLIKSIHISAESQSDYNLQYSKENRAKYIVADSLNP